MSGALQRAASAVLMAMRSGHVATGGPTTSLLAATGNTPAISTCCSMLQQRWGTSHAGAPGGSPPASPTPPPVTPGDAFIAGLQNKTEQQLLELIRNAREEKLGGVDAAQGGEEEEDEQEKPNPETGEVGGPRGREPTRFGDWENKGKCIDF